MAGVQFSISVERLEVLALFAREIIATRSNVSDATYDFFKAAGYSEGNALDVILGISLATLCNLANVFAVTPPLILSCASFAGSWGSYNFHTVIRIWGRRLVVNKPLTCSVD